MSEIQDKYEQSSKLEYLLTLEGVFSTPYIVLIQGAVFTALAIYFNLNEVLLGLAGAFPMVFQTFQILSPIISEKIPSKKTLLIIFNSLGRFLWAILLPFLFLPWRDPKIFLIVFALSQAFAALAGNAWLVLISDNIPSERRGKFLGYRNVYVSLATLSFFYIFSQILDNVERPYNFLFVLIATLVFSFLGILTLIPIKEKKTSHVGNLNDFRIVFSDKNFRKLSFAYMYWNLVILLTAPFFPYHQLHNVKLQLTYISYATIVSSLLSMLFYAIWGKLADRIGHKTVLIIGIALVAITPAIWILMNEDHWPFALAMDAIISGIGWAAVNLAFVTFPMEVARKTSPLYFAMFSIFGGIGGMLGAVLGGFMAKYFNSFDFYIKGYHIYGLQIFFLIESVLRFTALQFFKRVESTKYVAPATLLGNAISMLTASHNIRGIEQKQEVVYGKKRLQRWW